MGRYFARGVTRVYWIITIADPAAPTRAEINAGFDLTPSLAHVGGFAVEAQFVDAAPVGARFVEPVATAGKVTGPCTLSLYEDKLDQSIRNALPIGFGGYVLFAPYGDVGGRRCETWLSRIATVASTWADDAGAVYRAVFAPLAMPVQNAVLPA